MFIHWGLYSILEGEWNGSKGHAEWIRETAHIPISEYEKLLGRFNPVKFDADAWAKMAKDAGMKYLVITSKHHDGFNLWDSPYTDWDVMSTPFKRDIMKELSEACKRQGIRFCMYHSIMDWHHPDYLPKRSWEGETWRQSTVEKQDLSNHKPDYDRFNEYLRSEVKTLIERYRPGVLWFDGEWESTWTHAYGKPLYDLCLKTDPKIVVNNRVDVFREGMEGMTSSDKAAGDFGTPEQTIPATGMPGVDWETCMTMNNNWGYNAADKNFKSTKEMIRMLCDIASKGGNFLMNIGPRPDGTFPDESVQRLKEIGEWMRVYGESVYDTEASPFKKLEWGRCTMRKEPLRASGRPSGIRSTTLYLHVFDWPKDGTLVVPGLGNDVLGARLLGRANLRSKRVVSDVRITVPKEMPNSNCSVVALQIVGQPIIYDAPEIVSDGHEFVSSITVGMSGGKGLDFLYTTDGSDPNLANRSNKSYKSNIALSLTTTVKARAFHNGIPVSGVTTSVFTKVSPWHDVKPIRADPGLQIRVFKGDWNNMPDFSKLTETESYATRNVDLGKHAREERVGLRFEGFLSVDRDEMYLFELSSDDGGRLLIDGKLVVDNDGLHVPEAKRGTAPLAEGYHILVVEWFNKTGGAQLSLKMAKLGEKLVAIPDSRLKH